MATPEEMAASMINNLADKTGRDLQQWLDIVSPQLPAKHGQLVKWLKSEHGVSHGFANLIAHQALNQDSPAAEGEALIDAQFRGKENLRPLYRAVVDYLLQLGPDVELAPKKAYVSVRRKTQFALLQPSTKTRLDVGIKLKGMPPDGKLEASGSFNAMVTHRVRVTGIDDIDEALKGWLADAYQQAG
ncbi:DUF4287 domain-containing protein [Aestuariibacter halophilus]|uniref:DUF4287 domain-containing protein n=1 Tax=Fluctibacter halophilus TaxID=226011 RepID=A0ABS8GB56_9ALTE|nr:DUF4287 domain-containing protein [Aestuariibacter halophilus]MCC2617830.1 DUF4287 domain-containing protein [Aestuariibacter halophilus]